MADIQENQDQDQIEILEMIEEEVDMYSDGPVFEDIFDGFASSSKPQDRNEELDTLFHGDCFEYTNFAHEISKMEKNRKNANK